MRLSTLIVLIAFGVMFGAPLFASAQFQSGGNTIQTQSGGNTVGTTLMNPLKADSLEALLGDILSFVIRIGAIVVILMLIFVGYKFVAAQGKEEEIRKARHMLLTTLIGALVLLGAQAIASGIEATVRALSV